MERFLDEELMKFHAAFVGSDGQGLVSAEFRTAPGVDALRCRLSEESAYRSSVA
jgi:hypothetical protein